MSKLPQGWERTQLAQIGTWSSGGTPSRKNAEYFGRGVPWVKSGDLNDGAILTTEEQITELGLENSSARLMPTGTISMALYGATIGKLGVLTFPAATNQACANVVPYVDLINPQYLFFYLLSERKALIEKGQGGAQPNISQEIVKSHPIVLAPLNEQRRIVAKLEELLSRVQTAQARLATIPGIIKDLRQSILSRACFGRLTSDWRKENPQEISIEAIVESLLQQRLSQAKTAKKQSEVEAIYDYSEAEDPTELPDEWRFITLAKLCKSFDYGTSSKSQKSGAIPVLRMGNIQDGEIDWSDLVYTSDKDEIRKYALQENTVLFNRTNSPELVGKTAIYRGERQAIFAGYLIRINNFDILHSSYLNYCLNTSYAKEFCLRVKTDGVSQSNINAQKLAHFELPFCPMPEQLEILRRVEALLKTAKVIEARYHKAKANADKLTQSILAKAFRGELVPQDPNDEPAAELLKRIHAARANEPKTSKPKQSKKVTSMKTKGVSIDSVKRAIRQLPEPRFAFSELRSLMGGDYDSLKEVVFELLAEEPPSLKQIFDKKTKSMRFERADQ